MLNPLFCLLLHLVFVMLSFKNMQEQKNKISIIIPVLNEAVYILKFLSYLTANFSKENIQEIIVVDGGSTDNSQKIISSFEEVILLNSPKGRARQLNVGAQAAKGGILYFLHADSFPPPKDFDIKIIKHITRYHTGCFRLKFENPNHFLLKISSWFTRFNFSLFRGGDQSLFIRKKDFISLNGYNEQYVIYEDIEIINRIYKRFTFRIIPDYVTTSERKFRKNGIWKLHFNFLMIHLRSWLGASPESLYQYYDKHIQD